jgi:sec-independent protein translocase protein TatA
MPGPEWIWVILAIVVLFGASRLPAMGRNLGLGIKEFKKGVTEASKDGDAKEIRGAQDATGQPSPADERERGTTP